MKEMHAVEVAVELGNDLQVPAFLRLPEKPKGLVLFAHGSGSSRHSPRNAFVADALAADAIGSLLLDLLTTQEESIDHRTGAFRFDIALLAERLIAATHWVNDNAPPQVLPLGYFGASTGAAAALVAAASLGDAIAAVVSRGGRPDLAAKNLAHVTAPTLLIVGGEDRVILDLNREAYEQLRAPRELRIVAGATHLFEERGALAQVARYAGQWFTRYLKSK